MVAFMFSCGRVCRFKDAILENGIKVQVPSYIVKGDRISVRTEDLTFASREK